MAGLVLFAMVTIPPGARRGRALAADFMRAGAVRSGLEYKRDALLGYERALKTDPFFNEAVLRSKLRYRRPGEVELRTSGEPPSVTAAAGLRVPDFVPSRLPAASGRDQMSNWALLLTSALLLATAFLLFDSPAAPALKHISLQNPV